MRTGTIQKAEVFAEAKKPALLLWVDFGEIGIKKTSAQITQHYSPEQIIGKQVIAVVNFPPKQIGPIMSECLILGAVNDKNEVVLLQPDFQVPNGLKIG